MSQHLRSHSGKLVPVFGFILAISVYFSLVPSVPFHPDESHWLVFTYYFRQIMHGDVSQETWKLDFWQIDDVPVARYVLGAGLLSAGIEPGSTNKIWNFDRTYEENVAAGARPGPEALNAGRYASALLGAVGVAGLAAGITVLAGPLAGLFGVILLVFNRLLSTIVPRAMAEGTLLAGLGWSFWAFASPIPRKQVWPVGLSVATGVAAGLAVATKISAVLILLAVILAGISRLEARRRRALIALGVGILAFYLVNPVTLYAPVEAPVAIFKHRATKMSEQTQEYPKDARLNIASRVQTVVGHLTGDYATLATPRWLPLDVLLALFGAAVLVARRHWPAFIWCVTFVVGVTLLLLLDWDRYSLPPVVVTEVLAAVALGVAMNFLTGTAALV